MSVILQAPDLFVFSIDEALDYGEKRHLPYAVLSLITAREVQLYGGGNSPWFDPRDCRAHLWIDVSDVPNDIEYRDAMTRDQARQIAQWVDELPKIDTLIVHCAAGISRSAAAAAAIVRHWGLSDARFFGEPYDPNPHIFRLLDQAFKEIE